MSTIKGLDVSTHNGKVDFKAVKNAGYDFVIIRAGFGRLTSQKDARFETYYKDAKAAGLNVGAYWYSYAVSTSDAILEANACLEVIKDKTFEMPIYYDVEEQKAFKTGSTNVSNMIKMFLDKLEKAGYFAGLYMSKSHLENNVNDSIKKRYALWVAQYNKSLTYSGVGTVGIWQRTSVGGVKGILGSVDLDDAYIDYPSIIKAEGLNGFTKPKKVSKVKGDVNLDGKVTDADALDALKASVGKKKLSGQAKTNADIDGDGKVEASDAAEIVKKASE